MFKIKAIDLMGIAVAAEIWFKKQDKTFNCFALEIKAATKLKEAISSLPGTEDTELIIDEAPF